MKRFVVILLCLWFYPPTAFAQQAPTDDPVATAPIRLGVIAISPRVILSNVGVDTNVFNSVDNPQSDFTFAVRPSADLYMRTGRGLLSLNAGLDFVYFQEFESQRSTGSHATGTYEYRFNKIRPYASAGTLQSSNRPGYEIDARVKHYETDFRVGNDFRIASKSTARVELRKWDYGFADDAAIVDQPLNQQLNRTLKSVELSWRQQLTALTLWVTRVSSETERFEYYALRNSDSFRVSSGFELGRFALIRGSAYAGFRSLTAADGGLLPDFKGVTADVDVSYTAPTRTRLGAEVRRDIEYSYDPRTPYFVQTGWTATLTQSITGKWDVQLSGGRARLAYQAVIPSIDARTDFAGTFGGGIGYALKDGWRASFDVDSIHRSSVLPGREYGGTRAGFNMSYVY